MFQLQCEERSFIIVAQLHLTTTKGLFEEGARVVTDSGKYVRR
jgi:hypothetical protein